MKIQLTETLLFTGDSITDCGRDRTDSMAASTAPAELTRLGNGYVHVLAQRLLSRPELTGLRVLNRGISGNRVYDLEARLEPDLLALRPTIVSILIGINDTWRRYDRGWVSEPDAFEASYRRLLQRIRRETTARIVLLEPFLLAAPGCDRAWRDDLDPKIAAIRRLAAEFADVFVPLDARFAASTRTAPAESWLPDGVHPSPAGHALIADTWMEAVASVS